MTYTMGDERKAKRQVDKFLNGKIDNLYAGIENPNDQKYLEEYMDRKSYSMKTELVTKLRNKGWRVNEFEDDIRSMCIPTALLFATLSSSYTGLGNEVRDLSDYIYIGMSSLLGFVIPIIAGNEIPKKLIKKAKQKVERLEEVLQGQSLSHNL